MRKKMLCRLLVVCMMVSVLLCRPAAAMVESSEYLDGYRATLTAESGKSITLSIYVDACGKMDKVGASTVYLYESSDGKSFSCIETYSYEKYPKMMGSGWSYAADPIVYKGTPGYAYFAIVHCYAGDSTGHDEKPYTTATVIAKA